MPSSEHPSQAYSALILAGGRGQRMGGQDKGWVHWQGKPLVEHALDRVRQQTVAPVEILISANRHVDAYAQMGARVVQDLRPNFAGPLAGVEAGLHQATSDWVLVSACDMPMVPLNLFEKLSSHMQSHSIVVATSAAGFSPLPILLSRNLVTSLSAYLDAGHAAVQPWLKSEVLGMVEFNEPQSFVNFNSLAQIAWQKTSEWQ